MKTIVNIDRIQKIHIYDAKPTGLKHFVKGVEEKRILFGLIRIQRKQDSRWKDYNYSYSSKEDLIKNNESLYVNHPPTPKAMGWASTHHAQPNGSH